MKSRRMYKYKFHETKGVDKTNEDDIRVRPVAIPQTRSQATRNKMALAKNM